VANADPATRPPLPSGVPDWSGEDIKYDRPPAGFQAAVVWMQAVHDPSRGETGRVEVDRMRLLATIDGHQRVVGQDDYEDQRVCGGLFEREPWMESNRHLDMPAEFDAQLGALVLLPHQRADKVYHWWSCERAPLPAGVTACWAEIRLRIQGGAAVQAGIDYWKDAEAPYAGPEVNNREAASTRWFFAQPEWQTIVVARRE
jgi:hypothetical protein